jgi:hypothetical protein
MKSIVFFTIEYHYQGSNHVAHAEQLFSLSAGALQARNDTHSL